MIKPHAAFDVQTTLARVTRLRVDTRQLNEREVQFTIGYRWNLTLDEDQLKTLWQETDCDSRFKDVFDSLKPRCLTYAPLQANR
ncbi:hypothetical protein [Blastomonas sp.]|uniref:hypothetical protein n=1 Tax=Blastomonas sp. TaxID=1909299 RepID=UPI00261ED3CE|nr:hypothetical protein [Blastomonas sp.]MDM7954755.1 hypothetical protein [Blastomonas sp.]